MVVTEDMVDRHMRTISQTDYVQCLLSHAHKWNLLLFLSLVYNCMIDCCGEFHSTIRAAQTT